MRTQGANIRLECDIASRNARAWMLLRLIEPRDRLIGCGEARSLLPVLNSIALRDLN